MPPTFRFLPLLAALVIGVGVTGASAQTLHRFSSSSGLSVMGAGSSFEVLTRAGAGKAEYFCAAGEYARRWLNARNNDVVSVVSRAGPSQYQNNRYAVGFTMGRVGPNRAFGAGLGGPRPGQSASVGHARALCSQAMINVVNEN